MCGCAAGKLLPRRSNVALPHFDYRVVQGPRVTAAVAWCAVGEAFAFLSLQMVSVEVKRCGDLAVEQRCLVPGRSPGAAVTLLQNLSASRDELLKCDV